MPGGGGSGSGGGGYPMEMPVEWNLACGFREVVGRLTKLSWPTDPGTKGECEIEVHVADTGNRLTYRTDNATALVGEPKVDRDFVRVTASAKDGHAHSIVKVFLPHA
ncbi:hypothetical protein [Nitrospira sp. M1]